MKCQGRTLRGGHYELWYFDISPGGVLLVGKREKHCNSPRCKGPSTRIRFPVRIPYDLLQIGWQYDSLYDKKLKRLQSKKQ
jgi:hypothetical protein